MQSRKALFILSIITIFPLLSSWGVHPALTSGGGEANVRNARSPNSRGRLSLNLTTGPATKHQKGKPGKGSPRLEKIKKKKSGRWMGRGSMVVGRHGGGILLGVGGRLVGGRRRGGRRELKPLLAHVPSPPPSPSVRTGELFVGHPLPCFSLRCFLSQFSLALGVIVSQ